MRSRKTVHHHRRTIPPRYIRGSGYGDGSFRGPRPPRTRESKPGDALLGTLVMIALAAALSWFAIAPHIVTRNWNGGGYIQCRTMLNGDTRAQNTTDPGWVRDNIEHLCSTP
jgi:hypothetical protein